MAKLKNQELLNDERVAQEISRHRWIESEKAGTDIGFDKAAADWLSRFSDGWMAHHGLPKTVVPRKRSAKMVSKKTGCK